MTVLGQIDKRRIAQCNRVAELIMREFKNSIGKKYKKPNGHSSPLGIIKKHVKPEIYLNECEQLKLVNFFKFYSPTGCSDIRLR